MSATDVKVIVDEEAVEIDKWNWDLDGYEAGEALDKALDSLKEAMARHVAQGVLSEVVRWLREDAMAYLTEEGDMVFTFMEGGISSEIGIISVLNTYAEMNGEDAKELLEKIRDRCSALIANRA